MVYTFLLHLCGRKELYGDRKDRSWHGQGQGLLFHNENIHIHCPLKCYGRQPVEKVITREAVLVFKSSVLNLKADVLLFFNFGSAEKRAHHCKVKTWKKKLQWWDVCCYQTHPVIVDD